MDAFEIRDKVARGCRICTHYGVADRRGHISAREGDVIYILGRVHTFGRTIGEAVADDVISISLKGEFIEGRYPPPNEKYIHTAIYQTRDDAKAVIHVHPFYATVLSIAGHKILPVCHAAVDFADGVPELDETGLIDTEELGQLVADNMKETKVLMLQGHGVVVVGKSIEEAVVLAVSLERAAQIQWMASAVGTPKLLPMDSPTLASLRRTRTSAEHFHMEWSALESQIIKL
ncbi:MAG: class II aldolase/adducin family protein [Chloroflexi bacterium]|nr:class II aldolase/adducin family protein [Chloroflexota bacterium]